MKHYTLSDVAKKLDIAPRDAPGDSRESRAKKAHRRAQRVLRWVRQYERRDEAKYLHRRGRALVISGGAYEQLFVFRLHDGTEERIEKLEGQFVGLKRQVNSHGAKIRDLAELAEMQAKHQSATTQKLAKIIGA